MLLFIALLVVSVYLVKTGWRGRRVGDAPHCKACEFDLSGLGDGPADGRDEGLVRCPECGADVRAFSATVIGARQRRPRRLGFGLAGLALCATLGWFGAQGKLSTRSVFSWLPSEWMIEYAVRTEERIFAADMQRELINRTMAGSLTDDAEQQLADALETALVTETGSPALSRHIRLVDRLAANTSTSVDVRRQIAVWMLDRAEETDMAWGSGWGSTLAVLRADGFLTDDEWDELIRAAVTPRIWRLGDGPLAPGEEFVLGIDVPERNVPVPGGMSSIAYDFPESVVPVSDIGSSRVVQMWLGFGESSTDMPNNHNARRIIMRAPLEPGVYDLGIRTLIVEDGDDDVRRLHALQEDGYPNARVFESTLQIEVHEDVHRVSPDEQPLGEWLAARVLPARPNGSRSGSPRYAGYGMTIDLAFVPGPFSASGDLVAINGTGERKRIGSFTVTVGESGRSSTWNGATGSSFNTSGSGGHPFASPSIDVEVESRHLTPGNPDQLLLVFDTLELSDGRTHEGPEPLEVPVPPHPLGWSTAW